MAEQQVTTMVIKVGHDCEKCHKKINKVLCKIPQIQKQIYDKKANTVTITVVCSCPEKIKKKIYCKGGEAVKGIEIIKPKAPEKPKEPEKPKAPEKPKGPEKPKDPEKPNEPPKAPEAVPGCPPLTVYPNPRTCCWACYEGYGGGPCYGVHGRLLYGSWWGGCGCRRAGYYACRCDYVYENPTSCTSM